MKRIGALLFAVLGLAAAGPTAAQTTAYAVGDGTPNFIALNIPVTATVGGVCGFATGAAPTASYNFPNLDGGFTQDTAFTLNCNAPSRLAVVSANGGLKAAGTAPSGYTNLAPYNVALHMVGNGGVTSDGSCAVAILSLSAGSPCAFRGPASTSQGLLLSAASIGQAGSYVRIVAPVYAGANVLVASTAYSDTLTVTVAASL